MPLRANAGFGGSDVISNQSAGSGVHVTRPKPHTFPIISSMKQPHNLLQGSGISRETSFLYLISTAF